MHRKTHRAMLVGWTLCIAGLADGTVVQDGSRAGLRWDLLNLLSWWFYHLLALQNADTGWNTCWYLAGVTATERRDTCQISTLFEGLIECSFVTSNYNIGEIKQRPIVNRPLMLDNVAGNGKEAHPVRVESVSFLVTIHIQWSATLINIMLSWHLKSPAPW